MKSSSKNIIQEKLLELSRRANNRHIMHPHIKTEKDIKTENGLFKELEMDVYMSIERSGA